MKGRDSESQDKKGTTEDLERKGPSLVVQID